MTATTTGAGLPPELVRGLRRHEYDVLVETGVLDGQPVELIEGTLVRVSPQGAPHADALRRLTQVLAPQVTSGWALSFQLPLALGDSEPEPDVAVVADLDYRAEHPRAAALIVEVSRSSQAYDLAVKARVYAAAGIPEYWVLDVTDAVMHVHTRPASDGYRSVTRHRGTVSSASEPLFRVDVRSLLGVPGSPA